jgi:ABC-type transport system involved in cytochrome bd biosynthesis fused ATPase/permease subunit
VELTVVLHRITNSLHFQRQNNRSEDKVEAHKQIFGWALQAGDPITPNQRLPPSWPNLHEWLRTGEGIYRISGKAGSGKSTLMKFLHEDPQLQEALELWVDDLRLLIVSFYF